jgi:hypothetical protein
MSSYNPMATSNQSPPANAWQRGPGRVDKGVQGRSVLQCVAGRVRGCSWVWAGRGRWRGAGRGRAGRGWAGRVSYLVVEVDLVARTHAGHTALKVSTDARVGLAAVPCGGSDVGVERGGDGAGRILRERLAAVAVARVVRFG